MQNNYVGITGTNSSKGYINLTEKETVRKCVNIANARMNKKKNIKMLILGCA